MRLIRSKNHHIGIENTNSQANEKPMRLTSELPIRTSLRPLTMRIYPHHNGKNEFSLKMPALVQAQAQKNAVINIPGNRSHTSELYMQRQEIETALEQNCATSAFGAGHKATQRRGG